MTTRTAYLHRAELAEAPIAEGDRQRILTDPSVGLYNAPRPLYGSAATVWPATDGSAGLHGMRSGRGQSTCGTDA